MINSDNIVAEITELNKDYQAGKLSADEYKELLQDIQKTKIIEVAADDLETKSRLNEMINGLLTLASAV